MRRGAAGPLLALILLAGSMLAPEYADALGQTVAGIKLDTFTLPDGAQLLPKGPGQAGATAKTPAGVAVDAKFLVRDALQRCGDLEQLEAFDARAMMRGAETGPWASFIAVDVSKDPAPARYEAAGISLSDIGSPEKGDRSVHVALRIESVIKPVEGIGMVRQIWCEVEFSGLDPAPLREAMRQVLDVPPSFESGPSDDKQERRLNWLAAIGPDGTVAPLPGPENKDGLAGAFQRLGPGKPVLAISYWGWESPATQNAWISFSLYVPVETATS